MEEEQKKKKGSKIIVFLLVVYDKEGNVIDYYHVDDIDKVIDFCNSSGYRFKQASFISARDL